MTRLAPWSIAALAALASFGCWGCSPEDRTLVRVGTRTVTVADYERAGRNASGQYEGPPDAAKATLVADLERRALMLEFARQQGRDDWPGLDNLQRENEQRALVQTLYARIANADQPVSEAEARSLYEARKMEAEVLLLYSSTYDGARGAMARLRSGEPFEKVAMAYNPPGEIRPDGHMGMISPGALAEPLDSALRAQPVGAIGGPYRSREGWFVMKIAQRLPHAQGSYESLRPGMMDLMRQIKHRAAFNRAYLEMKAAYDVQPAPGGAQLLFHVANAADPLTPSADQRRMPLATYQGGVYTLEDALLDLKRADAQPPAFQLLPAIEIWIEAQVMTRVAVLEARRRHLDEEPEIVASLRHQREQAVLDGVYQAAVANVPPPSAEQVQRTWERVRGGFATLDTVRVAILEVADSALAERVAIAHASRPSLSLADAAKQADPSLEVKEVSILYPTNDPDWQLLEAMFTSQQPGAWFGPEQRAKGWRFLQLVGKTVRQRTFEELPQAVQQNIAGRAAEEVRDARFNQFTDSLAAALHPIVNRDRIARLPWPVPQPLDVGR